MYKKQIDGLRGVLFLVVFTYHHNVTSWFLTYALPCFFVLSGFLITRILLAGEGQPRARVLGHFYARRALRILPVYYVVVAATWAAGILIYPLWHATYLFNVKLFLLSLEERPADLVRVFHDWEHGQIHLWSMGIEEQFYLLFPLVVLVLSRRARIPATALMITGSIGLRFWFAAHYPHSLYGTLLPVCGEYVLWGCLAAMLHHAGFDWGPPWLTLHAGVLLLAGLSLMDAPPSMTGFFQFIPAHRQTAFGLALSLLVVGLWINDDALLSRFLRFPVLTFVGKMSYGLYLMHLAMWDLSAWMTGRWPALETVPVYVLRLALVLALGMLSWHLLESPINNVKRRFSMPGVMIRQER